MTAPLAVIRSMEDLVEAFRARKNQLELSNSTIEALQCLRDNHVDKVLGPSRPPGRGFSAMVFDAFLEVFAIELHVVVNVEAAARMEGKWEKRNAAHYRDKPNRVSKALVERVKPQLMSELGRLGAIKVNGMRAAAHRSESARIAAKSRWRNHRRRKRLAKEKARAQISGEDDRKATKRRAQCPLQAQTPP